MRQIHYSVAMSLDGYIAGPHGEADWIIMDPEIDFAALFERFDTVLMGRATYEAVLKQGQGGEMPGMRTYVFSRTLRPQDHRKVTLVAEKPEEIVADWKQKRGKDIWLMGGGSLFARLLQVQLIDAVEVAVVPVLLGSGIPFLPPPAVRRELKLTGSRV